METVISIDAVQRSFRLLELPPDILSSFSSQTGPSLHLKSASTTSSSKVQSDPGAVLCTQDKTFEIRQVQSSNNLYILRPSQHEIEHKVELSAIAQCNGLLELIFKRSDVSQYLRSKLPIYDTSYATENLKAGAGLKDVFMDSPFSIAEIRDGLKELCVFQHDGICWMPSARVVKEIWLAFMNSMTLEGISINKDLDTSHARRLISEDGHNLKIFDAIMKHVCNCDGPYDQASINSSKCIPWIGLVLLETNGESSIQKGTFVSDWRDHLPEAWRPEADLQLLQDKYVEVEEGKIVFKPRTTSNGSLDTNVKPASTSKSKWHERFKSSK